MRAAAALLARNAVLGMASSMVPDAGKQAGHMPHQLPGCLMCHASDRLLLRVNANDHLCGQHSISHL